jgi:hypothetical protein
LKQKPSNSAGELLARLADEPALTHELLFYSTFADKTFAVMQREGSSAEGFPKLQQTFLEAVERVRAILTVAAERGSLLAKGLTEVSPNAMAQLMDVMHDLAIVKQSQQK